MLHIFFEKIFKVGTSVTAKASVLDEKGTNHSRSKSMFGDNWKSAILKGKILAPGLRRMTWKIVWDDGSSIDELRQQQLSILTE